MFASSCLKTMRMQSPRRVRIRRWRISVAVGLTLLSITYMLSIADFVDQDDDLLLPAPPQRPIHCSAHMLRRRFRGTVTAVNSGFAIPGNVVWGGSVIRGEDGQYHIFASRWDERLGHGAWVLSSEVVHGVASGPMGPFRLKDTALHRRGAQHWDGMATHNPSIHWDPSRREYALFYIGITYGFEAPRPADGAFDNRTRYERAWNTKRIGVATSSSLDGPWKRLDAPVLQTRPGHWDAGVTSNPAPYVHPDGTVTLFYKSIALGYPERNERAAQFHIGAAHAPTPTGPYTRLGEGPILQWTGKPLVAEDPYLWRCGVSGRWQLLFKVMSYLKRGKGRAAIRVGELAYTHTTSAHDGASPTWAMPRLAFNSTVGVYRRVAEAEAAARERIERARRSAACHSHVSLAEEDERRMRRQAPEAADDDDSVDDGDEAEEEMEEVRADDEDSRPGWSLRRHPRRARSRPVAILSVSRMERPQLLFSKDGQPTHAYVAIFSHGYSMNLALPLGSPPPPLLQGAGAGMPRGTAEDDEDGERSAWDARLRSRLQWATPVS